MANVLNADGTADPKTRHVIMLAKMAKEPSKRDRALDWHNIFTCIDYASQSARVKLFELDRVIQLPVQLSIHGLRLLVSLLSPNITT